MNRRRERRRASDIARVNPRRGLTSMLLFGIALAVILIYQFSVSEDAADIIGDIVGDPEMTLPATALDKEKAALESGNTAKEPSAPTVDPRGEPRPEEVGEKGTPTVSPAAPVAPVAPAPPTKAVPAGSP